MSVVSEASTSTPTGRLFRSLRAEGSAAQEALPALSLDQVVGLRSVTVGNGISAPELDEPDPGTQPDLPLMVAAPTATPAPSPAVVAAEAEVVVPAVAPAPVVEAIEPAAPRKPGAHAQRGLSAGAVWLVVIGITVVMGFADALAVGQTGLGWLTGVSLVIASVYAAIAVRPQDALIAVVAPPLAFFLATITAGQLTLTGSGDLLVREAFMIVTTLGANALWIFGATVAALVIVLVRRSRSRQRP